MGDSAALSLVIQAGKHKMEIRNCVVSGLCYLSPTVSQWERIKAENFNDLMIHKEQVGVLICKCKIGLDFSK